MSKDRSEYHKNYYLNNKERMDAQQKAYHKTNPGFMVHITSLHNAKKRSHAPINMTRTELNEWYLAQPKICKIKGCDVTEAIEGKKLCVDHNHITGEVLGLLCKRHNLLLGHLRSLEDAEAITQYMKTNYQTRTFSLDPPNSVQVFEQ